jgi:hypothetical protein
VTATEIGRFSTLRRFNLAMAALHALQGALMLLLSNDFSLPVETSFVRATGEGGQLVPVREVLFDLPFGPAVASFLFMSAAAHLIVATVAHGAYVRQLQRGVNYARWIEYAFSASTMIVLIAMLVGIYELAALLLIFALNAAMILFGWMMELHNQSMARTDWTAFVFGSLAGIVPWLVIAIYLLGAGGNGGEVPGFVYAIFVSLFLFFNVFAVNMVLQYRRLGPWRDYLFGERTYIVLSLFAKSALAWQVFAGTLRGG